MLTTEPGRCPDDESLAGFIGGDLTLPAREAIYRHLDGCESCRVAVGAVARAHLASASVPPGQGEPSVLCSGDSVGRYVILHELGRGGMGVVYAGYDSELDRTVAIKVVGGDVRGVRHEARVMAKLSHPNVVSVFDVVQGSGHLVIVMEHIRGDDLRNWLQRERPGWRAVCELFAAAGKGLHAAHLAGVCHSDFKPSNVLISDTGRVCVADFGLADLAASRAGGTPAYLAPEQRSGDVATPVSDQYSFCVAWYEALCGERPSAGAGAEPLARRGVPRGLAMAICRGLAARPGDRHPDLSGLLQELARIRSGRRRAWSGAVAVAVTAGAVAAAVVWMSLGSVPSELCTGGERRVQQVWGPVHRELLSTRLAVGVGGASQGVERFTVGSLTSYAGRWADGYAAVCEATHRWGEQSSVVLDQRMRCLEDRLTALNATVQVLTESEFKSAAPVARLIGGLPSISSCVSGEPQVVFSVSLPEEPSARAEVAQVQQVIARVFALATAGRQSEAQQQLDAVAARVVALGQPQVTARYHHVRGMLADRAGQYDDAVEQFQLAAAQASLVDDHDLGARALFSLMGVRGYRQAQVEAGLRWAAVAELALVRAGADDELVRVFHHNRGWVHLTAGDYQQAAVDFAAAIAATEHRWGADTLFAVDSIDARGTALYRAGLSVEAREHHLRALQIAEGAYGSESPELAVYLNNLALVDNRLERYGQALQSYRRALGLFGTQYGDDHPSVGMMRSNIGDVLMAQGNYDGAEREYVQAESILSAAFGSGHPALATIIASRGRLASEQGAHAEAIALLTRALALRRAATPDHPAVGDSLLDRGAGLCAAGSIVEARGEFAAAAEHYRRVMSPTDVAVVEALLAAVACELDGGRAELAHAAAQQAVQLASQSEDEVIQARSEFALARATLARDPQERSAAIVLGRRARQRFDHSAGAPAVEQRELVKWLTHQQRATP